MKLDRSAAAKPAALPHDIGPRQVHLWSIRTLAPHQVTEAFKQYLSPDEKGRADRFRFDRHRNAFILARGALRIILGRYLNTAPLCVEFTYAAHGKPGLSMETALRFNASHSGDLALFAFTLECELGVDIEQTRHVEHLIEIAGRFFCAAEAEELMSLPQDQQQQAFFLCWTRKEAYIKATGEGLSAALDSFRVTLDPAQPAALIHLAGSTAAARDWTLQRCKPAPGYEAALAYRDEARTFDVLPLLDPVELLRLL